jgi:hypothetical protein
MNPNTITQAPGNLSPAPKSMPRAGAALTGLVVLFLAFDGITKVIQVKPVMDACQKMGIGPNLAVGIGVLLLACTALYAIPRTAILGAIALTGFLGGATATHVILGTERFPIAFSIGVGVLAWAGLALRQPCLVKWILLRRPIMG